MIGVGVFVFVSFRLDTFDSAAFFLGISIYSCGEPVRLSLVCHSIISS